MITIITETKDVKCENCGVVNRATFTIKEIELFDSDSGKHKKSDKQVASEYCIFCGENLTKVAYLCG